MKFKKSVLILGTRYKIVRKTYTQIKASRKSYNGYCDPCLKEICIGLFDTFPMYDNSSQFAIDENEKRTLRHEIIHAFLNESGLQRCAGVYDGSWTRNEAMIDFFAIQSPKIFQVFQNLDIL